MPTPRTADTPASSDVSVSFMLKPYYEKKMFTVIRALCLVFIDMDIR